jgi:hypothetical protein
MPRSQALDGNIVATLMTFGSFAVPNGRLTKLSKNSNSPLRKSRVNFATGENNYGTEVGVLVVAPERLEIESLTSKLHELLEEAGISDDYEREIEFDDLPEETQEEIDQLNLVVLFREQLDLERSDPIIMTFLLHRLGQLNIDDLGAREE